MRRAIFLLFSTTFAYADMLGGEISAGFYAHTLDGTSTYQASNRVDFEDTLGFSGTQDIFFKAYIEHPVPLIPNIRLAYNSLSYDGKSLVPSFSWGKIEHFTGELENTLSLDYTDITLYYELLDNWIELDGGISFRSINGDLTIASRLETESISYSDRVPMAYGKAKFYIPSTDISLQGEINFMPFGSTTSYDMELSARYTFDLGLGVELGYKSFYLESDTLAKSFTSELKVSGAYASVVWDF